MSATALEHVLEAALLAAGRPLSIDDLLGIFPEGAEQPERSAVRAALDTLGESWAGRGVELKEVSSGFRFQVRQELGPWIARLWAERAPRYSRALLETLALIAYRQPVTRAEIEEVRGVSVSSSIVKTLMEREWIRVLGHREVPGRPALYGTTRSFLDAFGLRSLEELPALSEVVDLDQVHDDLFARVEQHESASDADAIPPDAGLETVIQVAAPHDGSEVPTPAAEVAAAPGEEGAGVVVAPTVIAAGQSETESLAAAAFEAPTDPAPRAGGAGGEPDRPDEPDTAATGREP
jgi:segregation and condensation protein B